MIKKPFTTRLDPSVLALAEQLAESERRSVTAVIELALIEYAERRGVKARDVKNGG
ncbi:MULTISPECIES: ribbon-helix-helix protein, CopG family [unclassified Mesorhizobium]|uniref:ribbon-helix-helix protein, CopG family n=1 Tax=unclassified Mesorhizobium TaxID=325217 RepID=UPI0012DF13CD